MKKFLVALLSAALLILAAQASAKPPSNDTVRKATVISSRTISVWRILLLPFPAEYLGKDEIDVCMHRPGIDYSAVSAYPCEKPRGGFRTRGLLAKHLWTCTGAGRNVGCSTRPVIAS